jgi:hypothetical protein
VTRKAGYGGLVIRESSTPCQIDQTTSRHRLAKRENTRLGQFWPLRFSIPIALTIGKAIGEAREWSKLATITAEIVIGVVAALLISVAINYFFGKEVEVTERKQP